MGLFSILSGSHRKSKFIKRVTSAFKNGDEEQALSEIYEFLNGQETFRPILREFSASKQDISNIVWGIMASGAGSECRGHFVPISAVLFPDTLSYLLRAQRGQVSQAEAYFQVMDYFERGKLVFEPELQFRR